MTGTFIHVPKAAGKTLKQSLSPHFTRRVDRHHTAASVFKHHPELQNSPTVVSVRNPWERIWSFYRYTKQIHIHNIDWDEWLYSPIFNSDVYRHYDDVDCDRNPLSLKTWVTDLGGDELVTDYIMFSDLAGSIAALAKKYNIGIELKTRKHFTDGAGSGYTEHYTDKQREYIASVCAWEIAKFNFKFK